MTIYTPSKHILIKLFAALGLITLLAACGGGGGESDTKDSTPDAFSFTPVTNANVNAEVSSSAISVAGINQSVAISITGGTYAIAGGAFTSAAGTVSNGQGVVVKVTSASLTNTAVDAVLTIGGVTGNFKVTTKPDLTPNEFSFTAVTNAVPESVNTSAAITVAGIDVPVPISITGGEYSINDGAFTSAAGTVSNAQAVKVRGTASASLTTETNVELTLGGIKGTYAITTLADTLAPTAQILFPPPVSMTEGNTILVRGSASDDYSTVTSVKVNGIDVTPKAAGDFSTWQVNVPLTASTDTNLIVTTEDSAANKSTNAAQVMIRQADHKNAFPNANIAFGGPESIVVDKIGGRNRLLVGDYGRDEIISIDLATAERSVFASDLDPTALVIEPNTQRLYVVDHNSEKLIYFNLIDAVKTEVATLGQYSYVPSLTLDDSSAVAKIVGLRLIDYENPVIFTNELSSTNITIISDGANGIPNTDNLFKSPRGIAFDKNNSRYLVTSGGVDADVNKHAVYAVDLKTGARSIFSSNLVGSGDLFSGLQGKNMNAVQGLVIDEPNGQAIVSEYFKGRFYKVDLLTGNRTLFSSSPNFSDVNHIESANTIVLLGTNQYLFVVESYYDGIYAVDVVTGERVIFSKSASTH